MARISLSSIFRRKERRKEPHSRQAAFEMLTKQVVVEQFLDEGAVHTRQVYTLLKP